MQFNFYEEYKNYSNIELLKILQQPENYQRAALEAAMLVLQEREVSEHERVEVTTQAAVIQQKAQAKKEQLNLMRAKAIDFLEAVLEPSKEVHPVKWLNVLLLLMTIQYLWDLFTRIFTGSFLVLAPYTSGGLMFYIFAIIDILYLFYVPFALYLLYKRRRWGWILLFADNMFSAMLLLAGLFPLLMYLQVHNGDAPLHVLHLALRCMLLYFLWRNQITEFFGVSPKTKKDTAIMSLIGCPLLLVFLYMLFT